MQSAGNRAFDLAWCELFLGDRHFSDRYVAGIQKVAAKDVLRVAKKYLRDEALCFSVIRPGDKGGGEEVAEAANADAKKPRVIRRFLPNGGRVLLLSVPDQPVVSIQVFFKGGLFVETPAKAGITNFMTRLLLKGTKTRKAIEIAREFDRMGGTLVARSGRNTFYIQAKVLKEDFAKAMDIIADCLLNPSFAEDEVERVRKQILAEIAHLDDDPETQAQNFLHRVWFHDLPYNFPVQGTEASIRTLTRKDLVEFYENYAVANNMVIAIFGGVDLKEAAAEAVKRFTDFPSREGLKFPKEFKRRRVPAQELYVKKVDRNVAVVWMAFEGMDVYNLQDRFAMDVLDAIISGYQMPGGWLHEKLRGKGLVYVVHAYSFKGLAPGYFGVYAMCEPKRVPEVIRLIKAEIQRARDAKFDDKVLEPAKSMILTAEALGRQTMAEQAMDAALNEVLELGFNFHEEVVRRTKSVSADDVSRVARKYLGKPVICVTTPMPEAVGKP
ncbi:MAG: pitrilysin family protein [Planctomycetia bacterium]|nr:pitrilysin family protein [Planctomycetia bacterium]